MKQAVVVKICGLTSAEAVAAAIEAGADLVGFVFFPPSPRHIDLARARELGRLAGGRVKKVALTVDADDAVLSRIVEALEPDLLQLHGRESPERAAHIKERFRRPLLKAIGIAEREDLASAAAYEGIADSILLDAKPHPSASRPGGNGAAFDWDLLSSFSREGDWLLSGGLTCMNVAAALRRSGADGVDVSSGVESSPGVKDPALIARFIKAARDRTP